MLVFEERGKPEYPEKNLSEQGREPTTNSNHIHGVHAGIWTRATLVGGEWFHLCATLALISKLKNVQTHTVFIDFLSLQVMDDRNCFQHFCPLHLQCLTCYWFRVATTPDCTLWGFLSKLYRSKFLFFQFQLRFTLLQSKIINADNGNPGLFRNWFFCGNSTECIGVETYFA